jgi:hypothetical protein
MLCGTLFLVGCGGSDGANDDRRAAEPMTNRPEGARPQAQPSEAIVALSGCVEGAPGTDQFVLRQVRFEPQEDGSQRETTAPPTPGITEGSWVRLDGADHAEELRQHAGQRVMLTGIIADTGRNTIGTAGTSGNETVSGDKTEAASRKDYPDKYAAEAGRIARESMANGTAAEVRVTALQSTGERCGSESKGAETPR